MIIVIFFLQKICQYDTHVMGVINRELLPDVEYTLYTRDGEKRTYKGVYYLVDNG